jgi:hypothetical protein
MTNIAHDVRWEGGVVKTRAEGANGMVEQERRQKEWDATLRGVAEGGGVVGSSEW